jgi:putative aminopeptidase FrvX
MKPIEELLRELTAVPALAGREDRMITVMRQAFSAFSRDVRVDRVGNVMARVPGRRERPCLLIFAHMDELGLVVRKIDGDGFLRFERVGGMPEKSLLGQWMDVHTDDGRSLPGLVGVASHHVTPPEKRSVVPGRLEMYLDVGCVSRAEVEALGIRVGDSITYRHRFERLAGDRLAAKSLDNRIGCAVLIRVLEALAAEPPAGTVYLVASVQEEFNVRGVWPAFQSIKPDASICLDVTIACDTPDTRDLAEISLGKGPAICAYEFHGRGTLGGLIPNPKLRRYLENTARREGIPSQTEVLIGIITDAAFSQFLHDEGVPTASLGVPVRYTHSPVEMCSLSDIDGAVRLLTAAAQRFDDSVDLSRGTP